MLAMSKLNAIDEHLAQLWYPVEKQRIPRCMLSKQQHLQNTKSSCFTAAYLMHRVANTALQAFTCSTDTYEHVSQAQGCIAVMAQNLLTEA